MSAHATSSIIESLPNRPTSADISNGQIWAGRIISGTAVLFFLFDAVLKLLKPVEVVRATVEMGYKEHVIVPLGITLLVCTLLYIFPRTAFLGAILLTGYLGGAVASNVAKQKPLFNLIFPIVFGVMAWGGLWLRDRRLRRLIPLAD